MSREETGFYRKIPERNRCRQDRPSITSTHFLHLLRLPTKKTSWCFTFSQQQRIIQQKYLNQAIHNETNPPKGPRAKHNLRKIQLRRRPPLHSLQRPHPFCLAFRIRRAAWDLHRTQGYHLGPRCRSFLHPRPHSQRRCHL